MKTAIAIDDWKRATFERNLKAAGFAFEVKPFTKDGKTLAIFVETEDDKPETIKRLTEAVTASQLEAAKQRPSHN